MTIESFVKMELTCDVCGLYREIERPYCWTEGNQKSEARKMGWSVGNRTCKCPDCNPKNKKGVSE